MKVMAKIPQLVNSIEILSNQTNRATFYESLKELRISLVQLPMVQIQQACLKLNEQNFDLLLAVMMDAHGNDIQILREVTWIALIYFSQSEILIDRLLSSGILVRYEKMLAVADSQILEQVG